MHIPKFISLIFYYKIEVYKSRICILLIFSQYTFYFLNPVSCYIWICNRGQYDFFVSNKSNYICSMLITLINAWKLFTLFIVNESYIMINVRTTTMLLAIKTHSNRLNQNIIQYLILLLYIFHMCILA